MERNTVSEGLLVRYDVRNGQYKPAFRRAAGTEHAMGTYTPRILRGTEFYIGPSADGPRAVEAPRSTATESDFCADDNSKDRKLFVVNAEESAATVQERRKETTVAGAQAHNFHSTGLFILCKLFFYHMAFFGLFYPSRSQVNKTFHILSKIYGVLVIVILWANVFRLLFCFHPNDGRKPDIVIKLAILGWFFCSAVSALVCFWAWNSNYFPQIFLDCERHWIKDKPLIKTHYYLKTFALCCAIFGHILMIAVLGFGMYAMFGYNRLFTLDDMDVVTCPLNKPSVFLAILFIVSLIYTSAAWILPLLQVLLISTALYQEFQQVEAALKSAIASDKNFHRHLEDYRQRHLSIIHLTHTANKCFSIYSSATFIVNSVLVIALLGHLCLNLKAGSDVRISSAIFLAISAFTLCVFLCACVLMTSGTQTTLQTLLRYRVISGSSENSIQITLFLHQLSHIQSGLSVLGLFTVNKSTLLACFGVLALYLSVLMHILPAVPDDSPSGLNGTNASLVT